MIAIIILSVLLFCTFAVGVFLFSWATRVQRELSEHPPSCRYCKEEAETRKHAAREGRKRAPSVEEVDRLVKSLSKDEHASLRGACGVVGFPNQRPHSHVRDLARRLKEAKGKGAK